MRVHVEHLEKNNQVLYGWCHEYKFFPNHILLQTYPSAHLISLLICEPFIYVQLICSSIQKRGNSFPAFSRERGKERSLDCEVPLQ